MKNKFSHNYNIALIVIVFFFASCSTVKNLPEGETLLNKNVVINKYGKVEKGEIEPYIKQRPNRKVLLWKVHLYIYNSVNSERLEKVKQKRSKKREAYNKKKIEEYEGINERRVALGKKPLIPPLKKKDPFILREWWKGNGEPPVIYDTTASNKSTRQIKNFLNNKGYFNSIVKDSSNTKNKKTKSFYIINEGKGYTIRNITYEIKDERIKNILNSALSESLIKSKENYDVDVLQSERDRITAILRNIGYYNFSKEYIYFEADSSIGNYQIDIAVGIKNVSTKDISNNDSLIETPHIQYYISNVYIYSDYDPQFKSNRKDTLHINDCYIINNNDLKFKPRLILDAVFISKGELFQQQHADQTYRRLSELKYFKSIQIQFTVSDQNQLECYIYLSTTPKQSISVETEGINTSGTLGVAGNLVYKNKNVLKGGELFEYKIKGALEVQKTRSDNENLLNPTLPFNTLELGSEATLIIPRFLLPFNIKGRKSNNAKTSFSGNYNFQRRPDFGRSLGNLAFGYFWRETVTKQHLINPIEFNLINIYGESKELLQTIKNSNDPFLEYSYSDHFTLGTRYSFIFNNQDINKQKNFSFLRIGMEGAGNAMRGVCNLLDQYTGFSLQYKDGSYLIDSIPFSQFLRFDIDYRHYTVTNETDRLVYRLAFGIGKPLHNLRALPLEKSFFAGGPNSIRAWQARTLGPGGYNDSTDTNAADKIGDSKFEANLEYRFNIIRAINAALFIDAGNIWLRKEVDIYPNGKFRGDKFIGQIAIGAGMGIRVDFSFFIIRVDGAFKLKDPSLPEYDRWTFGKQPLNDIVLNVGIGYPF
jgi:outer membrane protein assembly factor BamA